MSEPVIAYVDGFNFYHGLMDKGWGRFRWLDFHALMELFLRGQQRLVELRYFTSLMDHEPRRLSRQKQYLRALEKHTAINPIVGYFKKRSVQCQKCEQWYTRPQEKQTDVNLATHLIADAFDRRCETIFLLCADSDLAPAVRFIKQRFETRIVLIDPPHRHSDELAALADQHLHIARGQLRDSQLPNPVEYEPRPRRLRRIHRPPGWDSN